MLYRPHLGLRSDHSVDPRHSLGRRQWLQQAAWAAAAMALPRSAWSTPPTLASNPFALGVASGEPSPDGMVLWTRLILTAPGQQQQAHSVRWELADDAGFRRTMRSGQAPALPALGHSVHVELQGLPPGRWYYYRFMLGDAVSATGRTRTAPAASELPARLRIAFASCQRWEHGYYAAWQQVAADQPDLVLFLGDYIYEYASPSGPAAAAKTIHNLARLHSLAYPNTLADYRDRYALHKSDPQLQAAHAACPWMATWDDHEVQNDYASTASRDPDPAHFAARRLAAWQAYYENMPLRATSLGGSTAQAHDWRTLQIYRRLRWGQLAHLHLLDARQYRTRQACRPDDAASAPAVRAGQCAELSDPGRSLLGQAQERWLDEGLAADARSHGASGKSEDTATRWSVIAQQTLFSPRNYPSGITPTDSWDGYPASRQRVLQSITQHAPRNTVLLGGDIHQNYVCNVHAASETETAAGRPAGTGPIVASEFCGTSISSRSGTTQAKVDALVRHNPQVLLARCEERGYGLADITPQRWTTQLRVVDDPLRADSACRTLAQFVVEDGRPGPQRA